MSHDDIAIIGMSCRVPGAADLGAFWANLRGGVESREAVTEAMLERAHVPPKVRRHPGYVRWSRTLAHADAFDPSFFYLSGREAELMDPQLRVFLETSWQALEHAGHDSERFDGSIGVYAASFAPTYLLGNLFLSEAGGHGRIDQYMQNMQARMGNDCNYLATRTSYHLNLTGPSMAVQTACSSSLVAVHLAASAILAGECEMALAGGVSIRFPQHVGYIHERDGITSPDGRCRPFDANAKGTVFGDGAGVVVLRRLSEAVAAGDRIWAVIRGSAVGNEGAKRVGYAAPSVDGQVAVLAEAVAVADLEGEDISYVEAHGTGTPMGDPIELAALREVYGGARRCALGSVKANIGHLSVAAGVVGLIKVALMLHHRERVPTPNFTAWNPECAVEGSPFEVETAARAWEGEGPLRAAVSSFGMGGTNCHVVLEEAPRSSPAASTRELQLLPVSAKSPEALAVATSALASAVESASAEELADAAYTLASGRRTFNFRSVTVARDGAAAAHGLAAGDPTRTVRGEGAPAERPIVLMFPGQGAQHPGMGARCYTSEPVYREVVERCGRLTMSTLGVDMADVLYPKERGLERKPVDLKPTQWAQPALFIVEYALAKLWESWGITPSAMIGHSVGEYVAACLAGVMSLEDALRVVCRRGQLVAELPTGEMAAVLASAAQIRPHLTDEVALAAINEQGSCTIAGPREALAPVLASLERAGWSSRRIPTSHAFHSSMMDPAVVGLESLLGSIELFAPRRPFVSNLTGTWITDAQATDPSYWAQHLRQTVAFEPGISTLLAWQECIYIEVGPGQTLASFVRRHEAREPSIAVLTSLGRSRAADAGYENLLLALGRLWALGQPVDWAGYYAGESRRRQPLPTYPFEHRSYFVEPSDRRALAPDEEPERLPPEQWVYQRRWRELGERVSPPASETTTQAARGWIVFTAGDAVGSRLVAALAAEDEVVTVTPGERFAAIDERSYTLRPDSREDLQQLFASLHEAGRDYARIAHALLLEESAPYEADAARFESAQRAGLYSLVALAQSLATSPVRRDLAVLSSGIHSIVGHERIDPSRATAAVAVKVLRQEYPHLRARLIDVEASSHAAGMRRIVQALRVPAGEHVEVAVRGPRRWVPEYDRVEIGDVDAKATRLRQGGRYLITGGLGEIGCALAEHLAHRYAARLVLLVHEPLPPREQWDDDAELREPTRLQLARHRRLEQEGVDFVVEPADIADEAAVARVLERVDANLGGLDGVFHLAGRPGEGWDRIVAEITPEVAEWHFHAKARGQLVLERLLAARSLDFVLCFSSLAGILGGLRLLPYGAANHFMDVAAERSRDHEALTPWFALGWDVWQHHQDEKRALSGIGAMMDDKTVLVADGMKIIEQVLALPHGGYYAVSTWDLPRRLER